MAKRKPVDDLAAAVVEAFNPSTAGMDFGSGVSYSACRIFCSYPTTCPLCSVAIPANTTHSCSKKETR